jgi:type I restriction enzyme S subunit
LNSQLVGSIQIPVPPKDEQERISELLSSLNAKIESVEKEIRVLDELFGSLLEELMTGQLSVKALIQV